MVRGCNDGDLGIDDDGEDFLPCLRSDDCCVSEKW